MSASRGTLERLGNSLRRLPVPALVVLGFVAAAAVAGGSFYAYRTYDYIEHDNDFCMSCHLMQEPYELFGESAHRGLGCKACHQPTLLARSQMALTQVLENPDSLAIHAEVPNERCAECHIEGDPDKWRLIASSVGHKVHLESEDSVLQGLQCVECHSTSIHEFAPVDRTCAQSQCHADSEIRLGRMSELAIHCAACHNFVAPITPVGEAQPQTADREILPGGDQCFSCHVMRTLAAMPDPDPHGGSCASCHNPHEQSTPAEAVASCATSACHAAPDTLTPFHQGLSEGVLDDCAACHTAHDFHVDGADCAACHAEVGRIDPSASPLGAAPVAALLPRGVGRQMPDTFRHSEHLVVECADCHATESGHGTITVTTVGDCQGCHHRQPLARDCARCHAEGEPVGEFTAVRAVAFSVGSPGRRAMPFGHAAHEEVACATCHIDGVALSAQDADCAGCHEEHHEPETSCLSCHAEAPLEAHPVESAHVTCSGAGCHTPSPFEVTPRTRQVCLGCHQDQVDHHPEESCADCHTLPPPRRTQERGP